MTNAAFQKEFMRQRHLLGTHAHLLKALHINGWNNAAPAADTPLRDAIDAVTAQFTIDYDENPYYTALSQGEGLITAESAVRAMIEAALNAQEPT